MLLPTLTLLEEARNAGYAIGAFNVYNMEGVIAVVRAAEAERSPAILQVHPSAFRFGGRLLIDSCLAAARSAEVPIAVHLDHSTSKADVAAALESGVSSIMADGSHLPYSDNVEFTSEMRRLAWEFDASVEAELGRLSGTEDGLSVPEYEALLTDPSEAQDFVERTGAQALAVCIGNVHGRYPAEPRLDCTRLADIRERVSVPLVLHGASGLPEEMVRHTIELGVCKFNVNTEVREAFVDALRRCFSEPSTPDLLEIMSDGVSAMQEVIASKMRVFRSSGRA